ALPDLFDTHEISIVDIAALADRDIELKLVVIVIRKPFANVVGNAARAQRRTGEPPVDRIFGRDRRDAFRAHLENLVVAIHPLDIVQVLRNRLEKFARARDEVVRNVVGHTADPDVAYGQPPAAAGLNEVVDFFAR